jgi:hypothetical protein
MANPVIVVHSVRQQNTSSPLGLPFYGFFERLTASFVVPAIGADVGIVVVDSTRYAVGQYIWILGAGWFEITALNGTTGIYVRNNGSAGNSAAGTAVPTGTMFMPTSEVAAALDPDDFFFLYDTLAQAFTVPVAGVDAYAYVSHSGWYAIGMVIYIAGAGWFEITDTDATLDRLTVQSSGAFNAAPGVIIAAGARLYPCPTPTLQGNGDPLIQRGITGNVTLSANNFATPTAVVFPTAFAAAPTAVLLTMHSDADAGTIGDTQFYVSAITAAGFNIVHDSGQTSVVQFCWIAMA